MSFEVVGPLAGQRQQRSHGSSVIRVEEDLPFPGGLTFGLQRVAVSQADQAARAAFEAPLPYRYAPRRHEDASRTLGWLRAAGIGNPNDEEKQSLLSASTSQPTRARSRLDSFTGLLVCTGTSLWLALLFTMYYGYWVFSDYMHYANDLAKPYLGEAVNATMSMIQNAQATTQSVRYAAEGGEAIVATSLPQMFTMLNATQAIVTRLERLAAHPVVKLSLGGDD